MNRRKCPDFYWAILQNLIPGPYPMKRYIILILFILIILGCGRWIRPNPPEPAPPKINARVLVYLPDEFVNYRYSYTAILSRFDYDFKDSVNELVPLLFTDVFVKADIIYNRTDLNDDYDFLVVPEFISVNLFTDKVFGNDLLIYIKTTFLSKNNITTFTLQGVGKVSDDGVVPETPELGRKAFAEALKDLKENILENRSLFLAARQNIP
jgi:hypothetical protein